MAFRAADADEDAAQSLWGQGFRPAAELPLGAELYVSTVDLASMKVATAILSPVIPPTASSTERLNNSPRPLTFRRRPQLRAFARGIDGV
jgi:hypothetical protein